MTTPKTAAEFLEQTSPPEGDFEWDDTEAEWSPYYCEDCDTFHLAGRSIDISRKAGKIDIVVRTGDTDGNWDLDDAYLESEGDTDKDWLRFYEDNFARQREEYQAEWDSYYQHVAETGEDPVHEFNVARTRKVDETWEFKFNTSIVGPMLVSARRGGAIWTPSVVPQHIKDFLNLDDRGRLTPFNAWGDFVETVREVHAKDIKALAWVKFSIENAVPISDLKIRTELKRLARKTLKRNK